MDFDSVLKEVGDFGKFQKRRLVLLGFPLLVGTLNVFLQVFTAGKSNHWCQSWKNEDCKALNLTRELCDNFKREISIPVTISEDDKTSFEQCEKYSVTASDFEAAVEIAGRNISLETISCDDGWVYDRSTFPSTIIMDVRMMHVLQFLCMPYYASNVRGFGRRKAQLFSFICGGVFGIATTFSLNFWMYVVLRFITAVLLSGSNCFVLSNEMVGPSRRVLAGNVIFFIPESPRWLVNQSRTKDAEKDLRNMARENDKPVGRDFTVKNCTRDETHHSINLKGTFLDLIRSPVVMLMMINMTFNWTVQAFVYYGLSLSTSELGIDPYISFVISGAIAIPAYFSCVFVAEWFGRKGATFVTLFLGHFLLRYTYSPLRASSLKIKFVTNTTKESKQSLHDRLTRIGFKIDQDEIFTSLTAARNYVEKKNARPFLILSEDAKRDFEGISTHDPTAVVVGLSPESFNYETLNKAFRLILEGASFIAIHKAKYYKRPDGLALGPGPFVQGLEYATGVKAAVVGKPEEAFFHEALQSLDCKPEDALMIGDDVAGDVEGAQLAGMRGILVKTDFHEVYIACILVRLWTLLLEEEWDVEPLDKQCAD
ncbi:Haloacid dehalogenase-like hydrolase domain-containing protein 2 [Holothuria leucospilota]|uniref:Haloacid dehalogenase-like hydrolase domain-containing protein 2 n=1 Tax=Holothuria leucospilota TaxID=206669 RepID=A0A9Q1C153_HOLLE|nr:Haloacid dehalogenase-like hydrolase domain-containing protein 2 [Holothuria leucospilota]